MSFEEASQRKTGIEVNKRQLGVVRVTAWYKLSNLIKHRKGNHLDEVSMRTEHRKAFYIKGRDSLKGFNIEAEVQSMRQGTRVSAKVRV